MGETLGSIIFSDHALERLSKRKISREMIQLALAKADKTFPGHDQASVKFIKTIDQRTLHVIATYLADQKKWLVISAWVRGEADSLPFVWQLISLPFRAAWLVTSTAGRWFWQYLLSKRSK